MEQLKRVSWKVGQPLLPRHLVAQEDSLIAYNFLFFKHLGLPFHGIGRLKWDDTLLLQGIISISHLTVVFASGQMVDIPGNGMISTLDLNKIDKIRVSIYLHLLPHCNEEEDYFESGIEHEKITFSVKQLMLSDDSNAPSIKAALKLGEFEKDLENRWKLCPDYIPPLLTCSPNPFLSRILIELKTKLEQFQNSLEITSSTTEDYEGHTLETKLCLLELSKIRRLLLNIEMQVPSHPYFLYVTFNEYLDAIAVLYKNKNSLKLMPYQHEKLGPLFNKLMEALNLDRIRDHSISHVAFEKRERCYVSEKLPQELHDAKEIYLILQKVESIGNPNVEGVKLSAYSRLMNIVIFGVQGIPLIRLERAPFNHNFSKRANIYSIEKGIEWGHALKEERLAFEHKDNAGDLQAFLYWR